MANTKEIQDRIKSINDTLKDHKCHVYDFFFEAEKVQERCWQIQSRISSHCNQR